MKRAHKGKHVSIETNNISAEQYASVLEQHESHFVDLKAREIAPASLTNTVSAFANASGGEIYVGVDEVMGLDGPARVWRGFEDPEAANAIVQTVEAMSPLGNHYEATFLARSGATGLVLHLTIFKSRDILFASNGKAYIRRSAQKLPLDEAALQRLKYDKGITSFEDERLEVDLSTVTNSLVTLDFLLKVVPSAEPLAWLLSQRLIVNDRATVAAVLLFSEVGRDERRF